LQRLDFIQYDDEIRTKAEGFLDAVGRNSEMPETHILLQLPILGNL
jgi:hypothetical protein